MYESSSLQFVRTTSGIQSGPEAFDESRFAMTFLAILEVTEILCSVRLVIEQKIGKEIPESSILEFSEKFLANNFALSEAEDKTSWSLTRGGIADLLRMPLVIGKKSRERMHSFILLAYASLRASGTLLQPLLICLNIPLDSDDLFCW